MNAQLADAVLVAADVFSSRRWRYGWPPEDQHVPDAEELAALISYLVRQAVDAADAEDMYAVSVSGTGRWRVVFDAADGQAEVFLRLGSVQAAEPREQ